MLLLQRSILVTLVLFIAQTHLLSEDSVHPKCVGLHDIIAMERDGIAMDTGSFNGATIHFTDDKFVATSKDGNDFLNGTYKINSLERVIL